MPRAGAIVPNGRGFIVIMPRIRTGKTGWDKTGLTPAESTGGV